MPRPLPTIPVNTIGRLSLYRRLLLEQLAAGARQVYSHQLASLAVSTAAQVRRDLMTIGFTGSPRKGYAIQELVEAIDAVLARSVETAVALVGVGNLGRAILAYYANRQPVRFAAAFDRAPEKTGRILHGCRCYPVERDGRPSSRARASTSASSPSRPARRRPSPTSWCSPA